MSEQEDRSAKADPEAPPPRRRRRFRRFLLRAVGVLSVFALLGVGFFAFAEHYTAQPNFCASCHIMEPYYQTWQNDPHGGKANVACVDCHYAPGERSTINAKMRGLSQLASYFSGRFGATRPRAHVAPESCLTSNCHGDYEFMDKPLKIGTISFRHSMHLKHDPLEEKSVADRLSKLREQLEQQVGPDHFGQLETAARVMGPTEARVKEMALLCEGWGVDVDRAKLSDLVQLEHRPVRLAQLKSLQCVDCHANNLQDRKLMGSDVSSRPLEGQHHFSVQKSSCYTCHFKNQAFNTGTGECMVCHEPPTKQITVHGKVNEDIEAKLKAPALAEAPVLMDHSDIVARNVDCRSCHADVVVGDSSVARRDCERCHDQSSFFSEWKPQLTTEIVTKYHAVHVPQQRAKCLDCHTQIEHQLAGKDAQLASNGNGFLASPMSDCTHCHTDQHRDVMNLLLGQGGHAVATSDPNMMFGSRTNCFGCHTEADRVDGSDVMVATQKACISCHGEEYGKTFVQWKEMLELSLKEAQEAHARARDALAKAIDAPADARTKAQGILAGVAADIQLVSHGNGVHNVTFALELLDHALARCNEAIAGLEASQ